MFVRSYDYYDKIFKHEGVLQKHTQAAHEYVTLYFEKDCPYDEECVFVHEESKLCMFGLGCERTLCMFWHEGKNEDDEESDSDSDNTDDDNMEVDVEDIKPVLEKLEEAFEKLSLNLKKILDH